MTTSISSVSPQRRNGPAVTPYYANNQQTFSYAQPMPSPQSHGSGHYQQGGMSAMSHGSYAQPPRQLRGARPSNTVFPAPRLSGDGILPTPDPTNNSVISDEDVALQLMRLGDASNFSHGRTSTSTLDDALSGKAEAPSSDEENEDVDETSGLPAVPAWPKHELGHQRKKQRMHEPGSDGTTGDEYDDNNDSFRGESDDVLLDQHGEVRVQFGAKARSSISGKSGKPAKQRTLSSKSKTKVSGTSKPPMSPTSLPSQSRKASTASLNFQHQFGADDEDLSSKPRCQRCRKSKKGCDRQRPCGRCRDAGLSAEQCISEDEGNGRKGRYGRHMGVPIKKDEAPVVQPGLLPAAPIAPAVPMMGVAAPALDKSKKRKRDSDVAPTKAKTKSKPKKEPAEPKKKAPTAAKGKKNGVKSKAMVESEDEGDADGGEDEDAGPSKKASPPPAKKQKRDKDEDDADCTCPFRSLFNHI